LLTARVLLRVPAGVAPVRNENTRAVGSTHVRASLPKRLPHSGTQQPHPGQAAAIPRVLHHMFKSRGEMSAHQVRLMRTCLALNAEWRSIFWDDNTTERFVRDHYGWFYSTWTALHPPIKRVDSSRYMILHHYGGIYVDVDGAAQQDTLSIPEAPF
jgi:mannosyltransferase OCH1-like enzyme